MSSISMRTVELPTSYIASRGLGESANWSFIVAVVLLVTSAYIMPLTDSWRLSLTDHYVFNERLESYAQEGSRIRQFALGSLGLFGLFALLLRGGKRLHIAGAGGVLAFGYLAWCGASILWADDPSMSFRRFASLMCEALAALAVAKRTSPRQFSWIVFSCTLTWMTLGIVAELSLGTMRPWQAGYRFSGIFHPNAMSMCCAMLTLSSIYLSRRDHSLRGWVLGPAALGFLMVLLTASRSGLAALILTIVGVGFLTASRRRAFVGALGGVWLISFALLLVGFLQVTATADALSLGRADHETSSLSGRLPLWEDLLRFIGQRPLAGHGYSSFWTVDHIREISESQTWPVFEAHSAYLDLLLNVGIVGAFLCVSALLLAFVNAIRLERRLPDQGYGLIAALLLYGLAAGFFETTLGTTWFWQFFVLTSVCYLAFVDPEAPGRKTVPSATPRSHSRPVLGHGTN